MLTVIVKVRVTPSPAVTVVTLSVFVMDRSAVGSTFVGAEALSLPGVESGVRPVEGIVTLLHRSTPAGFPLATHEPV